MDDEIPRSQPLDIPKKKLPDIYKNSPTPSVAANLHSLTTLPKFRDEDYRNTPEWINLHNRAKTMTSSGTISSQHLPPPSSPKTNTQAPSKAEVTMGLQAEKEVKIGAALEALTL